MNKLFFMAAIILILLSAVGCNAEKSGNSDTNSPTEDEGNAGESFTLKAVVKSTEEAGRIEVEVIESDYAFGIYWALINDKTAFCDSNGNAISADSVKAGDTIEITYGGQVMMSYPPQIVASKISVVK